MFNLIATIGFIFLINGLNRPPLPQMPPQPVAVNLPAPTPQPEAPMSNCAWLPWWDFKNAEAEFVNSSSFEVMSPFIYSLNENGQIISHLANERGILAEYKDLYNKVIPTISNDFDPERVSEIINNPDKLAQHIADIVSLVNQNEYSGIDLDYEYLKVEDKNAFVELVKQLSEKLHEENKELVVTVHAKTKDEGTWHGAEAQNWEALAQYADKIRVMAYDFTSSESQPGPIAPIKWIEEVANYAAAKIPKEKAILALGLYGYEWKDNQPKASQITLNDLIELKQTLTEFTDSYDNESQSPKLAYGNNTIWYENAQSFKLKLDAAKNNFSGICIWRLGGTPEEFFDLINN